MARRCKLGNTYCREARVLWSDCQEAYRKFLRTREKADAKAWDKRVDKYLEHRSRCIRGKRR